jgi:hypothetical protein
MTLHNAVPTVVIVVSLIGAFIALRGSMIVIRNSMDDFMDDLKRQSRWAMCGRLQVGKENLQFGLSSASPDCVVAVKIP